MRKITGTVIKGKFSHTFEFEVPDDASNEDIWEDTYSYGTDILLDDAVFLWDEKEE